MNGDETEFPASVTAPARLEIGDTVLRGRYRIAAILPGGQEAEAYRGTRLDDGTPVFVKHLWRPSTKHRTSLLEKLRACDHSGCVRLLDFELLGRPIEIYEWVHGTPLAALLVRGTRVFTDDQIGEVVRQLTDALGYLHGTIGTSHRDVKPSNILVTEPNQPRVKLADYGSVTFVDAGTTMFHGTKKYAPPEAQLFRQLRDSTSQHDWWSLGRVVQELADGIHPYDRIAATIPGCEPDSEAMEAVWAGLLSEDPRLHYGRAGQVEHSAAAWQPLLRGLLTTDRDARWSGAEVRRWLAGEAVPDAYDARPIGVKPGAYDEADIIAEVRRLSTPEAWNEACRLAGESKGLVKEFRATSDNKRARRLLDEADAIYDRVAKSASVPIAEDVLAMLTLRTIGGPACPLSLRGYELDVDLLLELARKDEPGSRPLLSAFARSDVLDAVEELAPDVAQRLRAFANGWSSAQRVLEGWVSNRPLTDRIGLIARYSAQPRYDNERLIERGRAAFAGSKNRAVADAMRRANQRSDAEAAALAFAFANAEAFELETMETVERRRLERERAERAKRDDEARRAAAVVTEQRTRAQAYNRRRMTFALAGAGAGAFFGMLLSTGVGLTITVFVTMLLPLAGLVGGVIVAGRGPWRGSIVSKVIGGYLGGAVGMFGAGTVRFAMTSLHDSFAAPFVCAALGATIGIVVHRVLVGRSA